MILHTGCKNIRIHLYYIDFRHMQLFSAWVWKEAETLLLQHLRAAHYGGRKSQDNLHWFVTDSPEASCHWHHQCSPAQGHTISSEDGHSPPANLNLPGDVSHHWRQAGGQRRIHQLVIGNNLQVLEVTMSHNFVKLLIKHTWKYEHHRIQANLWNREAPL